MRESQQDEIFSEWLSQYRALLFKVVRIYAFETEDQNDLFQEISLQVWRSIPRFRGDAAVSTWLYRIALNTAIKWVKKEKKHRKEHDNIDQVSLVLQESSNENEQIAWLYEQIARMHAADRSLCLLLLDGLSYRDMVEILGISESNVAVKIHRMKKELIEKSEKIYQNGV